jgi:hypothetical protein
MGKSISATEKEKPWDKSEFLSFGFVGRFPRLRSLVPLLMIVRKGNIGMVRISGLRDRARGILFI